ncbi:DUF3810 domain-containing protein [Winogradskyella haliclonae]|uniref:DUF3810 domain-containing protein n=1 Tax=Winogradskyella haliclonae TaxID=2048558 RepID=A0ABQ2C229_9FLAO|nr:DUF3810 domain-containing protein [Winogradskyella haliclonae]GGI58102.1 hypothetical protein GCM10011444_24110 [Winogradskyella haliclonae]
MRITKKGALLIFLVFQIILINILKHYPEFVEQYYSNGLYVLLSKLMRYSFGWIPFSVGDMLYTLAGVYVIRWFVLNFKNSYKDSINWLLDITSVLSITYFAFHILWGYNYYRQPLHKAFNIKAEYSTEQLIAFTERLIEKSNLIHRQLSDNDSLKIELPYTKSEVFDKVQLGYLTLSKTYPHLVYQPQSLKKSIYSTALTYMGFSGYLNPFTNEAQVDGLIPVYKFPTTSCHEVAHQLGYAAENEANFIGMLASVNNDNIYFKYSGYTFALRYCLSEVYKRDPNTYKSILERVNKGILKNYKDVQDFWKSYQNPLEPAFEKTFDTFLKANNQTAGIKSYSYIVGLLVNYYDNNTL